MADLYGWSLRDIFEYVTPYDVAQLTKYAMPRRQRAENGQYRTLAHIINVATYHEKGAASNMQKLLDNFIDRDEGYTERPFDAAGLNVLAKRVQSDRAKR